MSILQKEFYFIRHGEVCFNVDSNLTHELDPSLTPRGIKQALSVQTMIDQLTIQTICVSPLKRALETKVIIAKNIKCQSIVINELEECSTEVWNKMVSCTDSISDNVCDFFNQAQMGINKALSYPGPVLIIDHGGIHWAMCNLMNIQGYEKKIGNCELVKFNFSDSLEWTATPFNLSCVI
ncbi:MAG: histidine phosphatase family protein [Parachlamydiaceae bacterium]|nr:histidine phosphatase family protein [Parachlamydiaceae bacterium]